MKPKIETATEWIKWAKERIEYLDAHDKELTPKERYAAWNTEPFDLFAPIGFLLPSSGAEVGYELCPTLHNVG